MGLRSNLLKGTGQTSKKFVFIVNPFTQSTSSSYTDKLATLK